MTDKQLNIMVFTDNEFIYDNFITIIKDKKLHKAHNFTYACSISNDAFEKNDSVKKLRISEHVDSLIDKYDLIISCHSKQVFPAKLVNSIRCINIHPGLNPYNRGWYPQVFSIINKKPLGATIHEMDEQIDHGSIIVQKDIKLNSWDTSITAYNKVIQAEVELLKKSVNDIIYGTYLATPMLNEGNYNSKQDFNDLCKLDLKEKTTLREVIDKLRALTHGEYSNAYYIDEHSNKIFIKISLEKASNKSDNKT